MKARKAIHDLRVMIGDIKRIVVDAAVIAAAIFSLIHWAMGPR